MTMPPQVQERRREETERMKGGAREGARDGGTAERQNKTGNYQTYSSSANSSKIEKLAIAYVWTASKKRNSSVQARIGVVLLNTT